MNTNKNNLKFLLVYSVIFIGIFTTLILLRDIKWFKNFVVKTELNLFDMRQEIISKYKKPNKDIVILDIDSASYEYIMEKYGSWPISRRLWGDIINNISKSNPKYIIFDLLFLKPDKQDPKGDECLIDAVKNNKNIYLSMNLDNYPDTIRKSPILNDNLSLIVNGNLSKTSYNAYINARVVMKQLSDVTKNIGMINVVRNEDGIIRNVPPVFVYKNKYYPHLSLLPAIDMFQVKEIFVKNNTIILDKNHTIPLDATGSATINWYGKKNTYKHISLWETVEAIKNNDSKFLDDNYKNKIIYVGTSATSLSDIKSTPLEKNLAGVELHANFLNNILDNTFIKKVSLKTDMIIALLLSLIIGYCVLNMYSVVKTYVLLALVLLSYTIVACFVMNEYNLWISLVIPYITIVTTFLATYCEKYLLKSKDYEKTYKLAVTDGLTQLYNHRFFQEQMINFCDEFEKSKKIFSLILIDIDFFKKFNDTYGHQSGDIVLMNVASLLKKNSKASDIVSRYGGEEMTIILPNTNNEEAVKQANKICIAIREATFTLAHGEKVNVTISLGVATVGMNGTKSQEIISYCDKCLYKAKEQGRNQVVFEI